MWKAGDDGRDVLRQAVMGEAIDETEAEHTFRLWRSGDGFQPGETVQDLMASRRTSTPVGVSFGGFCLRSRS